MPAQAKSSPDNGPYYGLDMGGGKGYTPGMTKTANTKAFFGSPVTVRRSRGRAKLVFPCGCEAWVHPAGDYVSRFSCPAHTEYLFNFGLHQQFGMVLAYRALVGHAGHQNSYRGTSGVKLHYLRAEEIVGLVPGEPVKPGTYAERYQREQRRPNPQPVYFSITSPCSGNGQNTAVPVAGATFGQVNCERHCAARAAAMAQAE